MADIILTGKDYKDLDVTYSDLNIIKSIYGTEYMVDDTTVVSFDINESETITADGIVTPTYPLSGEAEKYSYVYVRNIGGNAYARQELGYITGTITATTDDVIYDENSIAVSFKTDYDSYSYFGTDIITKSTYRSSEFVYNAIRSVGNQTNRNEDGRIEQITNSIIPNSYSWIVNFIAFPLIVEGYYYTRNPILDQYISKPKIISVSELDGTTIEFKYKILVWSGLNLSTISIFTHFSTLALYVAKTIQFKVQANTISKIESSFNVGTQNDRPYNLETNELMQYTNAQPVAERASTLVSNRMLDKTKINRTICTFTLLNLQKYEIIDEEEGFVNTRYIDCGDLVKIQDENGKYLGEYYDDTGTLITPYFEIVTCNGKWEGTYIKECVAKQVVE